LPKPLPPLPPHPAIEPSEIESRPVKRVVNKMDERRMESSRRAESTVYSESRAERSQA
jgi:hypothetical protein